MELMNDYILITDGAYSSSANRGGVGLVILKDGELILKYSKGFNDTTNNMMEILAIIIGLKAIKKSINSLHIVSDSQYALGVMFKDWKRNKNQKLLKLFDKEYERIKKLCNKITYEHIRGHGKGLPTHWDKWNDLCDKLAVSARQQI